MRQNGGNMKGRKTLLSRGTVYGLLLGRFGPQGWWPVAPRGGSRPRYTPGDHRRRDERGQWEICVGAILTQNTAWKNVEKALAELYGEGLMDVRRMAAVGTGRLAAIIRSSGYFNQKAARLKNFAARIAGKYGGRISRLLDRPMETAREELLGLNGIGPETADSMLLYAGQRTVFVVDAYTLRMSARLGWEPGTRYEEVQEFFQRSLPQDMSVYSEFHALIVALGKEHCAARPRCAECPLRRGCRGAVK